MEILIWIKSNYTYIVNIWWVWLVKFYRSIMKPKRFQSYIIVCARTRLKIELEFIKNR